MPINTSTRRTGLLTIGIAVYLSVFTFATGKTAQFTAQTALERALRANFDLQIESLSPEIAAAEIRVEEGAFVPVLFTEGNYDDSFKSLNSIDIPALLRGESQNPTFDQERFTLRTGVGGKLPWGTTYELSLDANKYENDLTQDPTQSLYSPEEYTIFGGVTLRQPLLKGFGRDANLGAVKIARSQLVITEWSREIAVINLCVEVLNAFYDLAYAETNVAYKREAHEVAERFLEETKRRKEVGLLGTVDVAEAQVRLSEAKEEILQASDFLRERQLELVRLLALERDSEGKYPEPTVEAELLKDPIEERFENLYAKALETRPDYQLANERIRQEESRRKVARNERLPELNLHFTYGSYGLGGSYRQAFDHAEDLDEFQWGGGITFSIPLDFRAGKAKLMAARMRVRQAELRTEELRERIALEIENAVRRLDVLGQRLETARRSVSYVEEAMQLEYARLENGQTTGFSVAELQRRLGDAQTRELAARVDLTKATTELWSVSGCLLEKQGIILERLPERNGR